MDKVSSFKYYALKITGLILVIFVLQLVFKGFTDFFILNSNSSFELWRFLTSIFLHSGLPHLIYNAFALALFGSILERHIGSLKFVVVFLLTGILANVVSVNFYSSSLGASGAIFGIIGALIFVRPGQPVFAFGIPMPIFVAGILWAAGDLIGAAAFLSGNPIDNTGNIAHLSGMVFGLIFGVFLRKKPIGKRKSTIEFHEGSVRDWEDNWINRR